MSDQVMTVTVKGIGDFSDVVNNVGSVQKALAKLKLPDKLGDGLSKNITAFYKEYEKYQKKITEGVKTQGDYNQVEKSLNNMRSLYQAIGKDAQKLTQLDMKDMLNLDTGELKKIMDELTSVVKQIGSVKIDTAPFNKAFADIRNITKNSKITGDNGLLNQIIGSVNTGQITQAKKQLQELENYAKKVAPRTTESGARMPGTLSTEKYQQLTAAIDIMNKSVAQAEAAMNPLIEKQNTLQKELDETKQKAAQGIKNEFDGYNQASDQVENLTESLKRMHQEEFSFNREAQNIDRQIQSYFGLSQMIRKVGDIAKDAFATVKELDAAMTETAVVTNFSVGDMWDMLPTYTQQANQLGSTIRDVYEAATLYYQQGLNTNQAMGLANETLKMARIAGLGAAEATDMMTAALRGFNMEINQQSAQKINDIYSELAAITASDTAEIGSAMERTASIANSANMEFATTSAFLAQMIETTREAPENLGTAMKTIVARFQEMKQDPTKLIDSEGVAMDANKVDKALKTIGVQLMDTKGEFRDLDDVFLEIASKWDSLSQGQQRYIATIAAGSRQQSRFIAMMSNYERTMELVDAANNSAGASQRQFEKTLDSMEAKLNKLKNAWDQFTMGLMNNQILKFGVDALTEGFTIVNKFIDILGKIPPKPFEGITKSILTLVTTLGMLQFGKKASRGLVMGGAAWWKGEEGGFGKNFMSGFSGQAAKAGTADGQVYAQNFNNALKKGQFKEAFNLTKDRSKEIYANQHLTGEYANTFGAAFSQFSATELSANWTPQIEAEIRSAFQRATANVDLTQYGIKDADEYLNGMISELKSGKSSAGTEAKILSEMTDGKVDLNSTGVNQMSENINSLNSSLLKTGASLQSFGAALQDTPLAPFGALLSKVGMLVTSFGGAIEIAVTAGTAAVGYFVSAWAAGVPLITAGLKAIGVGFKTLFAEMGPVGWAILAIMGIVAAVKGVDALWESQAEKLEKITDAAAAASEAYDSAKQETSELADAIEQVKANEDAFDGLVVGTAAFNEQLVNANEQIMELIKKYPMLNDPKYLLTDKNGLMHINDEGLKAVKEYQKQRQANASALNLIQTADLNSEESRQKAQQMRKVKGTDTTESYNQRLKEADLVEQQAKAQQAMAKLNAVNTALVDKEIHNREKVSAIMAEQYDARKNAVNLEGESIHDLKQEYADFYGYKYDKSTKKLTDVEGNEIDVDNATIKDAVKEIRVITNFEADGKSLDSMLNSIDSKFSNALGDTFAESGNLFSDIMSNNIDIDSDLLENLITNPDKLQSAVDALSEKEIAAVLGVSADAVAEAPDKYKDELTDKLAEKAANIAETQAQSYADLASMLAQTTSADVSQLIDKNGQATTNAQKANQQAIKEQLDKLTTEQKNTLSSIGNALSEGAGAETMRTFIKQATDIYIKGTQESITALDSIITDVNWSSPTARLKAYNDMINSADKDVQNLGNSLRNSSESSNLLGEAFEEFYDSSDFQEMAENMDKFTDSSGKLNATSIQEMAEQCGSLNNLLDTGAISAGGVAAALNAMGTDGSITILDLNENLLKFLSTANQLEDTLAEAHSLIENFDWGVDTGESEDFAKESTKKWKELYDNGEFGNQQLENYAKFVLGQERWNNELEKSGGNIEKALDNMSGDILKYSDGFEQAWVDMADSSAIQDVHYGEGGDIIWDTQGKTTEELVNWLAETRGITQEWAKLMVEDFANYSYDFKTELAANDFNAALKNGDYITSRKGADGGVNITQSEIQTLAAAQNKTEQEITAAIAKSAGIAEDELNIIKNIDDKGNVLMGTGDIASLNTQYSQAELGKDTNASWISQYVAQTRQGQNIEGSTDLKAAISGAVADGFQADQANEMARTEALKAIENGAQVFYDGVELQKEDLADSQAFTEKIAEITENSRWNAVGEAIAQGYISYIKGTENPNTTSNSGTNDYYSKGGKEGRTSSFDFNVGTPTEDPKEQARQAAREKFLSWLHGLTEGTNAPTEDPKIVAGEKSRQRWSELWSSIKKAFTSGTPTEDPKIEAGNKARENWSNIWASIKNAFTSGTPADDPKVEAGNKAREVWKGIWDKVKQAVSTNPEVNPSTGGGKGKRTTEIDSTGTTKVTFTGEVANPEELKTSLQTQIASILKSVTAQTQKLQTSVNATVNYKSGKQAKAKTQTATVDYKKGKQDKASAQSAVVNYTLGSQAVPQPKNTTVNYTLGSQANPKPKTVDISPHFVGSWTKTITLNPSGAKGINNKITTTALPNLGSLAKGSRYGKLGPKGHGGLTLTGEEGFEIAWLPSESRSMILGADGPQMINLPPDAVVYTHEQSEDILRKRQEIDAGSHAGRHRKGGGSSSGSGSKSSKKGGKSKKGKSKKKKDKTKPDINNFSIEEVVQFNVDQQITRLTDQIARYTKDIEKSLGKIGTTYSDILGSTQAQLGALQGVKDQNQALYDSYSRQLADYRSQQTYISYTTSKGKSKQKKINIGNYLNPDGSANYAAIAAAGGREVQEAIFKVVNSAGGMVDGMNKAQKAIADANDQIDEINKKIADTFYNWENQITWVYDLTQRLNNIQSLRDRFSEQINLELDKVSAGFQTTAKAIDEVTAATERDNKALLMQIANQREMINARKAEMENAYSWADEQNELTYQINNRANQGIIDQASENLKAAQEMRKYITSFQQQEDGSIYYEVDWARFEQDKRDVQITGTTYDAIYKKLDALNSSTTEYNNSIKDLTSSVDQIYQNILEAQQTQVDLETDLLDGLQEQTEQEASDLKDLSSSISDALQDLLDDVKRKLDERRKQEDNAKTERDISQKQQRLAALRADTAGGHQVEIAQLEKEIAESQQNYQRTLEDQLLDRLSQQADEAAQQRERQIELLEAANQIGIDNREEVRKWVENPEQYQSQITEVLKSKENFGEAGFLKQEQILRDIDKRIVEAQHASDQLRAKDDSKETEDALKAEEKRSQTLENEKAAADDKLAKEQAKLTQAINAQTANQNALNDTNSAINKTQNEIDLKKHKPEYRVYAKLQEQYAKYQEQYAKAKEIRDTTHGFYDREQALRKAGLSQFVNQYGDPHFGVTSKLDFEDFVRRQIRTDSSLRFGFEYGGLRHTSIGELERQYKEIQSLENTLTTLQSQKQSLTEKSSALQTEYANIQNSVNELQAESDQWAAQIKESAEKQQKLQEQITGITTQSLLGVREIADTQLNIDADVSYLNTHGAIIQGTDTLVPEIKSQEDYEKAQQEQAKRNAAADAQRQAEAQRQAAAQATTQAATQAAAQQNALNAYKNKIAQAASNKKMGGPEFQSVLQYAAAANVSATQAGVDLAKTSGLTWEQVVKAAKKAGYNKATVTSWWGSYSKNSKAAIDKWSKYATGGLADYTGPAWLDGTPSKPELVLNATDTKNFLGLRDVLSSAMKSTSAVSNSYGGDIMYDINIHVDKIEKDYDVDRVVDKVKKEITKGAGYRNVTQVRNFK